MTDIESVYAQLDHAHSEIRQLLQQRKDLRKERDAYAESVARSMRERSAEALADEVPSTWYEVAADRIRALPLLDGGDTIEAAPAEDFDAGWAAGHAHAAADAERISELEKQVAGLRDLVLALQAAINSGGNRASLLEEQYAELAALVHGHGEDIGQAQAAIRGLKSGRVAPRRYGAGEDG